MDQVEEEKEKSTIEPREDWVGSLDPIAQEMGRLIKAQNCPVCILQDYKHQSQVESIGEE